MTTFKFELVSPERLLISEDVEQVVVPGSEGDFTVLAGHSWAIGLLETRGSMGPATMRYLDAILGNLRSSGFSVDDAVHAFWLLDSYVYGHVIQETSLSPVSASPPATRS